MNRERNFGELLAAWRRLLAWMITMAIVVSASAQEYRLEGKVGGKYPIVMQLAKHADGYVTGRYAYKSTLSKNGDCPCSWLDIFPDYNCEQPKWLVRDCALKTDETWTDVRFNGSTLTANMKNAKGNVYEVEATVVSDMSAPDPIAEYYRSQPEKYTGEIAMFANPKIQARLQALMGNDSFSFLTLIFQTEFPIGYAEGMYWAGGFEAHNCCDPAAVWAYDTDSRSYYVWLRKNGREYTWSESGTVPAKFQELYRSSF